MEQQKPSAVSSPDSKRDFKKASKIIFAIVLLIGVSVASYQVIKEMIANNRISRYSVSDRISLREGDRDTGQNGQQGEKPRIQIAIAPIVSPEKSMETYEAFVHYIGEKLEMQPVALYRPTYSETNDLVRYRRCDFAIVCTYPFIRGEKEFGMQALVVPQIKGEQTYQSFILVPASSSATSLLDLRGKRFASADIISTTGWLFPAMILMESGENPNKFFRDHILTHSHDRSLQAVIEGFVDGAAVHGIVYSQMMEQDPSFRQKVKVLAISKPFGIPPIVIHPDLDPKLKSAIRSVLLGMHEDVQGKSILAKLQIDRFVVPNTKHFESLRLAIGKLEKWR